MIPASSRSSKVAMQPSTGRRGAGEFDRVVVINDSTMARGGAAALALLGARLIRERGVPVTYFAGDAGDTDGSLRSGGIDCVHLNGRALLEGPALESTATGLFNVRAYRAMREWIRHHDTPATIYHLHGWQQILSPSIFLALKPVMRRTLMHAHDYFLVCPNGGQMNYVTNEPCALRPMTARCIVTDCDKRNRSHKAWRVLRQSIRNSLNDLSAPGSRVALVQHGMSSVFARAGVPAANMANIPNPCVPFSETRIAAEKNSEFHFVGRLVAEKGIESFLLAARSAGVRARIIGDGPLRESLAGRFPEFVFEGWCDRPRLADLSQSARMLVMPSLYPEPFGLVVPEAIASGLPVLISDSALLAGEVVERRVGLAVDPVDRAAFAAVLRKCASDGDMIAGMSRRGFDEDNAMALRPQQWVDELFRVYAALLAATGAPAR